jgi:oligopeptide/dipeptide ABC transporter ATP-binding protein
MTKQAPLLSVRDLCKYFSLPGGGFWKRKSVTVKAVDHVNFEVFRGETLGLVGESGCGKTTTSRTIIRAFKPTGGSILFRDNENTVDLAALNEKQLKKIRPKIQMIFQDPFSSLNPRMTVGDIVAEPLVINQTGNKRERQERLCEMLTKVGMKAEDAIRYPHAFSGGQRQRIGIARALILNPSLVICDEPVSALDVSVQAQIVNLLKELQQQFNLTYIFVAHDLKVVRYIADRVAVMYAGRIVEMGDTETIFNHPGHPYTQALLSAIPYPDPDRKIQYKPLGEIADPAHLPSGCSFHPRCSQCCELCMNKQPDLSLQNGSHFVGCHLV